MTLKKADILYYPTIEFPDHEWVTRALLYWDRVRRIVPENYTPKDTPFITELVKNGLIKNIPVKEGTQISVAERFNEFLDNHQNVAGLHFRDLPDEEFHYIHNDKVYFQLWESFKELGLVEDEWAKLPKASAEYYMLFLADEMAKKLGMSTGTDVEDYWNAQPLFLEKGNFIDDESYMNCATGQYYNMALKDMVPGDVSYVTLDNLIKYADKRSEEKKQLREHVDAIIREIPLIEDEDQKEQVMNDMLDGIEKTKKEYQKSMDFFRSGAFDSAMFFGLPLSMTAASTLGGEMGSNLGMIGALVYGAIGFIRDYKNLKKNRGPGWVSYLLGIEKDRTRATINISGSFFHELIFD